MIHRKLAYANRFILSHGRLILTHDKLVHTNWLILTCAYRLLVKIDWLLITAKLVHTVSANQFILTCSC